MKMDFKLEGRQLIWDYLLLTVGALLTAFAFAAFFVTNDIAPGGVTGIATVLSSVTGLNVGLLSFLINVPLFAIGWRRVGVRFAVRSFISMLLLSLFIDLMPEFDLAGNMMLAAIFGGVTMGAGLGMVVRAGATTGGTDMAAMIVHAHLSMFTVPMVLFTIDGIVVVVAALNFGVQAGLFALIALFVSTKTMDSVIKGFNTAMQFLIISTNQAEIVRRIRAAKQAAQQAGAKLFVLDGAVIIGTAAEAECDKLCVVTAPFEVSVERIAARDGISPEMAARRLNAQTPEAVLTARADYILPNTSTREALAKAANELCDALIGEGCCA